MMQYVRHSAVLHLNASCVKQSVANRETIMIDNEMAYHRNDSATYSES